MFSRIIKNLSILCLLLLAACSGSVSNKTEQATNPPQKETTKDPAQNPTSSKAIPTVSTTIPEISNIWDDRSIFAQTLNKAGQAALQDQPMASVYHISLQIPEDLTKPLTGSLEVRYFNQESVSLEEIYFRLFPNYHAGLLSVQDVTVDEKTVDTALESDETALRVKLENALEPGESLVIRMGYSLLLPEEMGGNYGLLGYFEDILVLDTFYPMIPAFDEDGWYQHVPFGNGDLTYNDTSFYLVEVKAPADLVVAASGSVIARSEQDGEQVLTIAAGPARDFYLAASKFFDVSTGKLEDITVRSFALEGYQTHQDYALTYAIQAIKTFNELFGPYPYSEFEVISSPMLALGIEYPGITGIFWELYQVGGQTRGVPNQGMLESVIVHEVAHQWFYNVVGNDQQFKPWVDEALAQYVTYVYFLENYGSATAQVFPESWKERLAGVEDPTIPVGLPAGDYIRNEYSGIVYGRGPLFYLELEQQLGRDVLWSGIAAYYQNYSWGLADTEDLRASLESACSCDLTKMFETWIYPEGYNPD